MKSSASHPHPSRTAVGGVFPALGDKRRTKMVIMFFIACLFVKRPNGRDQRSRPGTLETKLSHHTDVVTLRGMLGDLSIAQLKPMDVLYLKALLRRLDPHLPPAVHPQFPHAAMRTAGLAVNAH